MRSAETSVYARYCARPPSLSPRCPWIGPKVIRSTSTPARISSGSWGSEPGPSQPAMTPAASSSRVVVVRLEGGLVWGDAPGCFPPEQAAVAERGGGPRVECQARVQPGEQNVERAPAREHSARRNPDHRPA